MSFYQLHYEENLKVSREEIWSFISSPRNLKLITPPSMGFDITSKDLVDNIYAGMMISYKVSPVLGMKMDWLTEITHVKEGAYFVDEQRIGPYALWHHQHIIEERAGGICMKDIITYALPLGVLGTLVQPFLVAPKLKEIFNYRSKVLVERYGSLT